MSFFSICPRDKKYLDYNIPTIPLNIVRDGIETSPDFKVNINKLNSGNRDFVRNSGTGDSFKVTVIIHKDEKVLYSRTKKVSQEQRELDFIPDVTETTFEDEAGNTLTLETLGYGGTLIANVLDPITVMVEEKKDATVTFMLDYFMRNGIPLYVISDVIGVNKNDLYLITDNKSRKQDYKDYTVWDLTFTKFVEVNYSGFKGSSVGVDKAIKKYKDSKKKKVSHRTTVRQKLAKCDWQKTLIYRSKKKVFSCVKYLQRELKYEGCYKPKTLSGWYGVNTRKAIKAYQEKHKKDYGLKVTGKMNQQTFNCLIGKPNQVGSTKELKQTAKKELPAKNDKGIVNVNVTGLNSAYSTIKVSDAKLTTTVKKKTVKTKTNIPKSTVKVKNTTSANKNVKLPKGTKAVNASTAAKSNKKGTAKRTSTKTAKKK